MWPLGAWLLSFSLSSRFPCVVAYVPPLPSFSAAGRIHCMDTPTSLFIRSSLWRHLGCFHILAIVTNAHLNITWKILCAHSNWYSTQQKQTQPKPSSSARTLLAELWGGCDAKCREVISIGEPQPLIWLFYFPSEAEKYFQDLKWFWLVVKSKSLQLQLKCAWSHFVW